MITPYPKVHRTRFAELGYWQVEPGCWSFVNFDEDGTPHQVSVDAGGAGETRRDQRRAAQETPCRHRRHFRQVCRFNAGTSYRR